MNDTVDNFCYKSCFYFYFVRPGGLLTHFCVCVYIQVRQKDNSVMMKVGPRFMTAGRMQTARDIDAKARVAADNKWTHITYSIQNKYERMVRSWSG